jgi:hypothetical protein
VIEILKLAATESPGQKWLVCFESHRMARYVLEEALTALQQDVAKLAIARMHIQLANGAELFFVTINTEADLDRLLGFRVAHLNVEYCPKFAARIQHMFVGRLRKRT